MDATKFTIPAGTGAGKCYTITTGDTGMQNATHKIPFAASQPRYVVLFLRNDGNVDVTVRYGVEVSGYRSQHTPTVVPAHGYATLSFTINDPVHTQADSWHELYIDTDIEETFDLTISGYYYNETKLQNIKISKNPEKVEYAIGETFDATGMVVTADYGNNVTRKLGADEFSVLIGSKNKPATEPLTEEDTEVYVIHQNKMAKLAIRVQHFEQTVALNGASFADGASSKVLDRNAVLPADIVTAQGKTLKHFIDQYNKTYVPGEGKVAQYDMVLTPVYEGEVKSENYAANASFTSTQTKHGGTCSALNNGLTCLNTLDHDRWGTIEFETAEGTNGEQPWLIADLGDVKSINQVVLYPRLGGSSSSPKAEYFPEAYKIYVSEDNATWTEVYFEDYDKYAGLNEVIARYNNFASVNARYVKVVGTKLSNDGAGYIFQLSEIEIFGNVQAA